jgi:ERCC4-type nuclease
VNSYIERKTPEDFFGSITSGRERFEREFARMSEFAYRALVIEADWSEIVNPSTRVNPASVVATLIAWSQRYGVHLFLCPGRRFAEQLTYRLLERFRRDQLEGKRTAVVA